MYTVIDTKQHHAKVTPGPHTFLNIQSIRYESSLPQLVYSDPSKLKLYF